MTKSKPQPEIVPCPWCESTRTGCLTTDTSNDHFNTLCGGCGSGGPIHETERDAILAWNRLPRFSKDELDLLHLSLFIAEDRYIDNLEHGKILEKLIELQAKLDALI